MIITGKKFSKPAMSRVKNGDVILDAAPEKSEKSRLDLELVKIHPMYNRSTLQGFIKSGYVTVDGKVVKKPNTEIILDKEPEIILTVPKKQAPPKLETLYEDKNVLVVNKPAGLLSMAKGQFTEEPTLEDYGLLVHRLDRDTSGVVILAKNEDTRAFLQRQFQERKTHKTYIAIVLGRPKLDTALIDLPIARNLKRPTTFLVDPKGKPAQTSYKVLESNNKYSLLELKPVTGRTHQLRVHLRYLNCLILGDPVYGNDKTPKTRLFLHAASLEITIPGTPHNQRKTFTAPLPEEFTKIMRGA